MFEYMNDILNVFWSSSVSIFVLRDHELLNSQRNTIFMFFFISIISKQEHN